MLHGAGHRNCDFLAHDLTADGPLPGGPFGVVYARLLLFHVPQRVAVLARLWDSVAPGGHLIVQDYDIRTAGVLPALDSVDELLRVINGAFDAAGCDVSAGARLAQLFAQAGVGTPTAPTWPAGSSRWPAAARSWRAASAACCWPRSTTASPPGRQPRRRWPRSTAMPAVPRPPGAVAAADRRLEAQGAPVSRPPAAGYSRHGALAGRLAATPGVVAVTLGGSRAMGTAVEGSDWDFGLYYRGGLDPADIIALGWPGRVFAPGEWGSIVNGGAWLTVDGPRST